MPLPLKTFKVFPNPWALIHHELGPQGAITTDNGGREEGPLRFVGATRGLVGEDKRATIKVKNTTVVDSSGDRTKACFRYPGLSSDLLNGESVEVSAKSGFYRHALENGDLVPADERTAATVKCAFKNLKDARAAGVKKFDADHGDGSWAELEKILATAKDEPPVEGEKKNSGGKV